MSYPRIDCITYAAQPDGIIATIKVKLHFDTEKNLKLFKKKLKEVYREIEPPITRV